MYGQSISATAPNKICFCRDKVYREIPLENGRMPEKDFRNNGINHSLNIIKPIVGECIKVGSNEPFWAWQPKTNHTYDLRNPAYAKELALV